MTDPQTVNALALGRKVGLGSGASFWKTEPALGFPGIILTDGPHGVRAQRDTVDHLGIGQSEPATCFPPAAGLAQSWDPDLVERIGTALGVEARSVGVGVLLGPGVNMKRDPRAGRNFEYFSEDPHLAGELGAAWVEGLQRVGVGASLKHFAANNTEHDRMRSSSDIDARALREVYLRAFQRVVTKAQPWTVMCSYNRINGVYAAENHWLLTDVLRHEWGFTGAVVSDWGAVRDRVAAVEAGLDLEMPGGNPASDEAVIAAVQEGRLDMAAVDRAATRIVALLERAAGAPEPAPFDRDSHHALAREAAGRSIALLKNDGDLLPLTPGRSIAVVGRFATEPRYQGGGSSHVNATRVDLPLEEIRAHAGDTTVAYAQGFGDDLTRATALRAEAVAVAAAAEVAVVFLGLTQSQESEGFDRESIDLPPDQLALLAAVVEAQPRVVVVLSHGGAVRLQEVDALAPAIIAGALLGQASGGGTADVLFGVVNPSGRLAETVPVRLEDTPAYLNFPGENSHVLYGESIFIGYRWYDARQLDVTYPFGHGLSYTSFEYDDLRLEALDHGVRVTVRIRNTGSRAGREVVQFYVAVPGSELRRAPRELKGFASVTLQPGEAQDVTALLRRDDLAYWEERVDDWVLEPGRYRVHAAASSRDLRLAADIELAGDPVLLPLTEDSTLGELLAHPIAGPVIAELTRSRGDLGNTADTFGTDMVRMMASIPVNRMAGMSGGAFDREQLRQLLAHANGAPAQTDT